MTAVPSFRCNACHRPKTVVGFQRRRSRGGAPVCSDCEPKERMRRIASRHGEDEIEYLPWPDLLDAPADLLAA